MPQPPSTSASTQQRIARRIAAALALPCRSPFPVPPPLRDSRHAQRCARSGLGGMWWPPMSLQANGGGAVTKRPLPLPSLRCASLSSILLCCPSYPSCRRHHHRRSEVPVATARLRPGASLPLLVPQFSTAVGPRQKSNPTVSLKPASLTNRRRNLAVLVWPPCLLPPDWYLPGG